MLVIEENDRISWYELFEIDLIKTNYDSLTQEINKINTIDDEMDR